MRQRAGIRWPWGEDILLAPIEVLSGMRLGDLSDTAPANTWARSIRREAEAVNRKYQANMEKGGTPARLLEEYGASTVAAVPRAAAAMLTGGASAAAQTTAGLTRTAAAELYPGVSATVSRAAGAMAKNPLYWSSFAQTVGGDYENALRDQRELEAKRAADATARGTPYRMPSENTLRTKAALYAIGSGLLNAAVEAGGGIETLPGELHGRRRAWKAYVDTMVDEGGEEVVQGIIQRALKGPVYGAGTPLFSTTDENAILNPVTAAKEFAGGAVVGGVLGGAQMGIANAAQRMGGIGNGTAIKADTTLFDRDVLKDFNTARKNFIRFAKDHFPAQVVNVETGNIIGISRTGLDKFLSGNIPYEKYASGFHIPELIERAHRIGDANNYHQETAEAIPTFEYYDSPIKIGKRTFNAHIRVKNTRVGDKYYGHTISEVEDIKIEPPTRSSVPESLAVHPENTGGSIGDTLAPEDDSTITGAADLVKSDLGSQIDAMELGAAKGAPVDVVRLYQQLLAEANKAKRIEALEQYYRKYVGEASGEGTESEISAAFPELERAYREAMGTERYDDETFRELKRLYEEYAGNPMEKPEDEERDPDWP